MEKRVERLGYDVAFNPARDGDGNPGPEDMISASPEALRYLSCSRKFVKNEELSQS